MYKRQACGGGAAETEAAAEAATEATAAEAGDSTEAEAEAEAESTDGKVYQIGVLQLVQHTALDKANEGFIAALDDAGLAYEACLLYTSRCV